MSITDQIPRGTELHLSIDQTHLQQEVTTLIRRLRGFFLPRYTYEHAVLLQGTTGNRMPLTAIVEDGVALMWKRKEPDRKLWIGPVSGIKTTFDPKPFTIVLLWGAAYVTPPGVTQVIPGPMSSDVKPPPTDGDEPPWDIAGDSSMPKAHLKRVLT